jgi:hypothetical protein
MLGLQNIGLALNALKAGESLKNAESWKNKTTAMNGCLALLGLVPILFPSLGFTDANINVIALAIVTVVGAILNAYSTNATSEQVGLKVKPPSS